MAIPLPKATGFASMVKECVSYYTGVEEAVIRSIEACNEFTRTLRTSFGPRGLNKIIINHLEKLFVTNDAATIIGQLEVVHPAAKLIKMASEMQEKEVNRTFFFCPFENMLARKAPSLTLSLSLPL